MQYLRTLVLLILIALVAAQTATASPPPDLSWIDQMPGVAVQSRTIAQSVYIVSGDADATFDSVRSDLGAQGFRVRSVQVTPARRVLHADRDEWEVMVTLEKSPNGRATLIVRTNGGQWETQGAPTVTGPDRVLRGDHLHGTFYGENNIIVVVGNHCVLTIGGNPREVHVSGSHNRIRIEGPVRAIVTPGCDNLIRYRQEGDAPRPEIENRGRANDIGSY